MKSAAQYNQAYSRRYLIVGSGAAGIAAAEAIRSQDPAGQIVLISEEQQGYYSRPGLAYYLTGEIPERGLFPFSDADFKALGLQRLCARVAGIRPGAHEIVLGTGKTIRYDRLLIATGSTAELTTVPGSHLKGVLKLDNLDDAHQILKSCRSHHKAVVVGGGITALEIVEGLVARKVSTTYFLRGERYWSNVLDETESRIVEHRLREDGVEISYQTELAEILGRGGQVAGVRTKDGRTLPCDLVAIAIGVRPRKELAQDAGLACSRGILVDPHLQTSEADIFAAGDVAEVYDPFTQRYSLNTLWGPARMQGRCAGLNMAGLQTVHHSEIPFNVTRLASLTTTIIGMVGRGEDGNLASIARGDSEIWRQLPDAIAAENYFEVNRLRLLVGKKTFVGAIVMGDQRLSQPLQQLVAAQTDISPIREQLLRPDANLGDLVIQFWESWKRNVSRPAGSSQQY
jgi:NAD(P)H-nitrite reductase large subunit